jgi:hypothetical protein
MVTRKNALDRCRRHQIVAQMSCIVHLSSRHSYDYLKKESDTAGNKKSLTRGIDS